jgi:FecR protein
MKNMRVLILGAICGAALLLVAKADAQDAKQGIATIIRIRGTATYTTGDGTWQPLAVGATLGAGAVIKTDPDSAVDIVLSDKVAHAPFVTANAAGVVAIDNSGGPVRPATSYNSTVQQNVIRMAGGTTLAIDKLTFTDTGADTVSDTELDLQSGKIFGSVKKLSAMSKYEVKTPVGVAGIRGTTYVLGSDGGAGCGSGSLVLSFSGGSLAGQTIVVNGGLTFDPATGQILPISGNTLSEADQATLAAFNKELQNYTVESTSYANDSTTVHMSNN